MRKNGKGSCRSRRSSRTRNSEGGRRGNCKKSGRSRGRISRNVADSGRHNQRTRQRQNFIGPLTWKQAVLTGP